MAMKDDGDRIEMSRRERDVLKVMSPVVRGERTQAEAGRLLDRSVRQIRRIERRMEAEGDKGVVHRLRGRPSNRRIKDTERRGVIERYLKEYSGFGPTFAAEKLSEGGLEVCDETLRLWLIEEGLWEGRRKRDKHRSRRDRKECFGEMVQADGSVHDWLEGRGSKMTLLVMIDDATSRAVARFYEAETTEGYMDLLRIYIRKHGVMSSLYTDRHSIFCGIDDEGEITETQFTRAMRELGIKWMPAGSPQAKGRVERFNGTAQDRLVKELRLAGARTIEEANAVLMHAFLPWFNRMCVVAAKSPNDAHRALDERFDLGSVLSIQTERHVANDYTVRHHGATYQILPPAQPGLRGGKVIFEERLNGRKLIRFKGKYLSYELAVGSNAPSLNLRERTREEKPAEAARTVCSADASALHTAAYRPSRNHPWRGFKIKPRVKEPDISILVK